jgi:hypothetical protein
MHDTPTELREISYLRLFPWVRLFRGVRVALDGKKLILAALGLSFSLAGWAVLDILFPDTKAITPRFLPESLPTPFDARGGLTGALAEAASRVTDPPSTVTAPFLSMFSIEPPPGEFWHGVLGALWAIVVWGLIGGAIARIAVVQVARGERVGLSTAVRFALGKGRSLIFAPLTPFFGVAFFAALCAIMGAGYQIRSQIVLSVLGVFAFLPLLAGLVMAIILLGLAVGWPLMHATIAAEAEDSFDALSRSYAYVYESPSRYAAYTALAWALGTIGVLVVGVFTRAVENLAIWGLSFGAPDDQLINLFRTGWANDASTAAVIHTGWITILHLLAYGWVFSYFWTSAAIIYLLLRHDVDGTDWADIVISDHEFDTPAAQEPESVGEPAPQSQSPVASEPTTATPAG